MGEIDENGFQAPPRKLTRFENSGFSTGQMCYNV